MEKISVYLADWQILYREGIHFTLAGEEGFEVIGETTSSEEAFDFIESKAPNVAIINANAGKPSGIEVACRIKRSMPSTGVIIIMDSYNNEQLLAIVKSGANGYFSKDINISVDELVSTIRSTAQGNYPISQTLLIPEIASLVLDEFKRLSSLSEELRGLLAPLLPVEADILNDILAGNLIEEIAKSRNINEEELQDHLNDVLAKLVANGHSLALIDTVQGDVSSMVSKVLRPQAGLQAEYISRDEFSIFKEKLRELIRSFISQLGEI
jgi:DNA-binding NarL/FixJ family response regulator